MTLSELKAQFPFWWPVRSRLVGPTGEDVWLYGYIVNWDVGDPEEPWVKIQTDPHNLEAKLWVKAANTESTAIPGSGELSTETYFPEVHP